jgi:hypothetical protein
MSGELTLRPATFFDACTFAGTAALRRKALVYQVRNGEAFVVERDGQPLALGMFWFHRKRRAEFALVVMPGAQQAMVGLVRIAHLTLSRMAESGVLVFALVRVTDARARRMASLVGFGPSRLEDPVVMVFRRARSNRHEQLIRSVDRGERQEGGETAAAGG